jgi:hypothetical protein
MSTPLRRSTRARGSEDTTPVPDFSAPDDGERPPYGARRSLSPTTSPLRNKRKSPTRYDMPALVASSSGAYGGAGVLRISESLQNQNSNFIEAFTNSRQGTAARASPERSVRGGRKSRETSAAASDNGEGPSSAVKRGRGRPKKVTMPAIDEDEVNNDVKEDEEQDEDADMVALSRKRQLSPIKRAASPSKRGIRAASVEGTTVMENSSNYLPAESVAQNVRRREPTPQPQPTIRNRPAQVRRMIDGPSRWQILKTRLRVRYRKYGPAARKFHQTYVSPYLKQMLVVATALLLGGAAWKYSPTMSTSTDLAHFSGYAPTTSPFNTAKDWSTGVASSVSDTVTSWTSWPSTWNTSSWWSSNTDSTDYSGFNGKLSKLDKRMSKIEQEMKSLMAANRLHDESIQDLKRRLPDFIMLEKDKNGKYKIPESFVEGLRDKLDHELKLRDESLSWDVWMKTNHKQVREEFRKSAYEIFEEEKSKIITSDDFIAMLDARYASIPPQQLQSIEAVIDSKFLDIRNLSESTAISIARHEAKRSLERLPEHQMRKLIASHMVQNQEAYDNHVNFFSAASGAMVIPQLSSSTIPKRPGNWYSRKGLRLKVFNFMQPWYPEYREPLPAVAALEPWFEAGDCWCAAPPDVAHDYNDPEMLSCGNVNARAPRLQLAVMMPRQMYPTHLIVEHVPRTATLNIHSAPRKMEVWVPIPDPVKRALVKKDLDYIYSSVAEPRPFATNNTEHIALDETYVRVSRLEYRPTAANHVQTFQLHIQLKEYDVAVQTAVVRAVTNWGSNHTCIYRLRMWGEEINPQSQIPWDYNPFLEYP